MEHVSLYRKWRPQTFEEVIGQHHVTNTLANALASERIVHAYLFSGPRGTGKTSTARILAKAINCENGPTAEPCNECEACVSISEGTSMDVIEIDAASNRKIDEIRDLLEKIPFAPTALSTKVYIIDEVHQLTSEASSALLKTLEEPPGHVVFVLATTEPHKLLPTIVSRCQRFDFSLVPAREISRLLERIASTEKIKIEDEALALMAEHAHGSVRDAISVMDQISGLAGEAVTQKQLAEILGEVEANLVFEMVDMISGRDVPAALALVGRMVEDGKEPRRFVESLIAHLRCLFLIQNAQKPEEIVEATEDHYKRLAEQAARLRRYEVIRLMERLGITHREMRSSENPRLVLECALVKAVRADADISLEGLVYRIEQLEKKVESLRQREVAVPSGRGPGGASGAGWTAETSVPAPEPDAAPIATSADRTVEERKRIHSDDVAGTQAPAAPKEGGKTPLAMEEIAELSETPAGRKEKARRAWVAVLAELKKEGDMRLYALLTKAKILEVADEELVLGFPRDATFQLEVLSDSDEMRRVEEAWGKLMGCPANIKLTAIEDRAAPLKKGSVASKGTGTKEKRAPGRTSAAQAKKEKGKSSDKPAGQEKGEEAKLGKGKMKFPEEETKTKEDEKTKDPKELAQMLKDRFDGEIVDE